MNLKYLCELQKKEEDKIEKITKKFTTKTKKKIEVKEVYQELSIKKHPTYCVGTIMASELIPYFGTVIVDLRPIPDEKKFTTRYGMSVKEMIEYLKKKRIVLRMRAPPPWYAGLDYLDPLLERHPPSTRRYKIIFENH